MCKIKSAARQGDTARVLHQQEGVATSVCSSAPGLQSQHKKVPLIPILAIPPGQKMAKNGRFVFNQIAGTGAKSVKMTILPNLGVSVYFCIDYSRTILTPCVERR